MKSISKLPVFKSTNCALIPGLFFFHLISGFSVGTKLIPSRTRTEEDIFGSSVLANRKRLVGEFLNIEKTAFVLSEISDKSGKLRKEYCSRPRMGIAVGPIFTSPLTVNVK